MPIVGSGEYHPFDKRYLLAGVNFQGYPGEGSVLEFEASVVPFISNSLWWAGAWGSIGGRLGDNVNRRLGAGVEAGWRFLAADVGYLFDNSLPEDREGGLRVRVGMAFAMELFSAGCAEYSPSCCGGVDSWTNCECDRTPLGAAWFLYWAHEERFSTSDPEDMIGISFKLGIGL